MGHQQVYDWRFAPFDSKLHTTQSLHVATSVNSRQSDPVDVATTLNDQHAASKVYVRSVSDESVSCRAVGGIAEVVTNDSSLIAIMEHVPAASMSTGAADVIRVETANDVDEVCVDR